ncbi:yiaab two helix domain-containing protein [Vibrio nigripulchritudo ATCC 27043]|uniref:inner membrane protein YiaA n=1 Tax=Vibrio nigripulchritudo TaxID=28173 RepID=UPI00021C3537|nr:inner membrane protein YiaA [Vibrio nigripulchritudo]EGU55089.1 yiaab two helix domain-containing protein [Vibrio nigripulchritudo ATCC 27043]
MENVINQPTKAFVGASWACLFAGFGGFLLGLWNSELLLNEKGFYFTVILLGLYAAISLQKTVRDKSEGIPVTDLYFGLSWVAIIASVALMGAGLWNADMLLSEKGFYGLAFLMSLFAAITVQKNTRDMSLLKKAEEPVEEEHHSQVDWSESEATDDKK